MNMMKVFVLFQLLYIAYAINTNTIPKEFDLRKNVSNCVAPISNQGQCGSAAALSTVHTFSINLCMTDGQKSGLLDLSSALVEDCINGGCSGLDLNNVIKFLEANGTCYGKCISPQPTTECPISKLNGLCKNITKSTCCDDGKPRMFKIKSTTSLNGNIDAMQMAIMKYGAILTPVDASTWQFYTGGVYKCPNFSSIDHTVYLIGWGEENNTKYWIAANSWGSSWGMNGYIYLQRGINTCGVEQNALTLN